MFSRSSPSRGAGSPRVVGFHDAASGSAQYVAIDEATRHAALIDIVQDFDPAEARTGTASAEHVLRFVEREGLEVAWILDTHPHADHFMASAWLAQRTGATTVIGARVREIAGLWSGLYNLSGAFEPDRDFDRLVEEGDSFALGGLEISVWLSPGHTLGSVTYLVGNDAAFVHDTLLYPDSGTARADFPGGSAALLWDSLQRILTLPGETRLFVGHDYGAEGRDEPAWEATVAEHIARNIHLASGVTRDDYVAMRKARDATLALPDRMLHALQVNLRGGRLPAPEDDGNRYLRIPVNRF